MKYKSQSLESEIVNSIYDTLAGNPGFPQFKSENIADGFVDELKGELEFNYTIDEVFGEDERIKKVKPKSFNVTISVDVFPERRE